MFVGYSEISLSITVKHVQHIGMFIKFSGVSWGQKKLLGCGLFESDQYPG